MEGMNSTLINDLPSGEVDKGPVQQGGVSNGQSSNNISMVVQEKQHENEIIQPTASYNDVINSLEQKPSHGSGIPANDNVSDILNDMDKIAHTGALGLPVRDIPRNIQRSDDKAQVNYVPQNQHYIEEYQHMNDIVKQHDRDKNLNDSYNYIFSQLQYPLLIALLYFFFHLPVINNWFLVYCSFCFYGDGNMNFNGYIVKSVTFGAMYFCIQYIIDILTG